MYYGRYTLGQFVSLSLACTDGDGASAAPETAPTVKVYAPDGERVLSSLMPPLDRFAAIGLFRYRLRLGDDFDAGQYMASFSYSLDGVAYLKTARFTIEAGGDADGAVIAMTENLRPSGKFLVQRLDSEQRVLGRVA